MTLLALPGTVLCQVPVKSVASASFGEVRRSPRRILAPCGPSSELEAIAQEVVRNNYNVIVTTGAAATQAVQKLTTTTPVVFAIVNDATGFVTSLARPGGNLTGLTRNTVENSPKHLEFLRWSLRS